MRPKWALASLALRTSWKTKGLHIILQKLQVLCHGHLPCAHIQDPISQTLCWISWWLKSLSQQKLWFLNSVVARKEGRCDQGCWVTGRQERGLEKSASGFSLSGCLRVIRWGEKGTEPKPGTWLWFLTPCAFRSSLKSSTVVPSHGASPKLLHRCTAKCGWV